MLYAVILHEKNAGQARDFLFFLMVR